MWDGIERRRTNRMANSFIPNTAFEGYVQANIENIKETLQNLPLKCDSESKRITDCEKKLANIEGKATMLGAIGGFLWGLLIRVFSGE